MNHFNYTRLLLLISLLAPATILATPIPIHSPFSTESTTPAPTFIQALTNKAGQTENLHLQWTTSITDATPLQITTTSTLGDSHIATRPLHTDTHVALVAKNAHARTLDDLTNHTLILTSPANIQKPLAARLPCI